MAKRERGQKFTVAEREELGHECWALSASGYGKYEIAGKLEIDPKTVRSLLQKQEAKRRAEWKDEDLKSVVFYESVIRDCDERLEKFPPGSNVQNVTGLVNAKLKAREQIDKIVGSYAPQKHEQDVNVTYRESTTGAELEQLFADLDAYVSEANGGHQAPDSGESLGAEEANY